jgi:glycosyltransferase involved in cell wall biosynthesis
LASGTPFLATDTGFARDLVTDDSGFLVSEDRNLDLWGSLLTRLITIKESVRNKDLLHGKYTWVQLGADFYF